MYIWTYTQLPARLERLQRRAVHKHTDLFEALGRLEECQKRIEAFNRAASAHRAAIEPEIALRLGQVDALHVT